MGTREHPRATDVPLGGRARLGQASDPLAEPAVLGATAAGLTRIHIALTAQDLGGVQRLLQVIAQRGHRLAKATLETRATHLRMELTVDAIQPELFLARLQRIVNVYDIWYASEPAL